MEIPSTYNESLLLRLVAEGGETAFNQLFQVWQPRLGAYLFRITESKELTEEIIQDVFLKIWINRSILGDIDNFKNYLFVISRNQARNELKKLSVRLKYEQEFYTEHMRKEWPEDADSFSVPYYQHLVDDAVTRLQPRQKQVWILNKHKNLSYQEIADSLNISRETVKSHLKTATAFVIKYVQSRVVLLFLFAEITQIFF